MTQQPPARQRLVDHMDRRRVALRLTWGEVATRAGMSQAHLRRIRNDDVPLSSLMSGRLEQALQWAPGSVDRIVAGEVPTEIPSPSDARSADNPPVDGSSLPASATDGVRAAIRELARALPPEDVRALLAEVRPDSPRYEDLAEQHIWETPGLTDSQRRQLVGHLQVMRRIEDGAERDEPPAGVREFRRRTGGE
ncbi:helix-turn-helix domain-containing protein [Nonomuraea bangladeshensis]|uniref:helix-turn-helix domain-containing protein n=1 Tax=Nonomuraea bangladeshensis TaxID=404385 RepID=UPI003C2FB663